MKRKNNLVAATLSLSAATIVLSGATAMASGLETKVPASGKVVTQVGKIVPVNLLSGADAFSFEKATTDCCGPYQQCHCPDFKGTE